MPREYHAKALNTAFDRYRAAVRTMIKGDLRDVDRTELRRLRMAATQAYAALHAVERVVEEGKAEK